MSISSPRLVMRGKFYDFARTGTSLTPGGIYAASLGSQRTVFVVDPSAVPGAGPDYRPSGESGIVARFDRPDTAMGKVTRRDAVAIVLVALACGSHPALPPFNLIHGWSIDALTALRWQAFGTRRDPASTPVVVIAIDEETYQTPAVQGLADPDLDHGDRPGSGRGNRRRR